MTWTKIGDEFVDDAADLSDAAVRTHVEALAWSNRRLLDLVIPKRDLRRFAFSADARGAAGELVDAGWWQDRGDAWYLAYRPDWQQSREQVETRRLTNLRAQWHRRGRHDLCEPGKCPALSAADTRADTRDDTAADPGRDGSGRDGNPNHAPTEDQQGRRPALDKCSLCGHFELLTADGVCSDSVTCHRVRAAS